MTPLAKILAARIKATGPISIADYMSECLLHPQHGYYTTHEAFGRGGDFTTAPEISQMFGEVLGLCLAQTWIDQGRPDRFTLAELGPGRGTLMADILRATDNVPGFRQAANVVLIEASERLRNIQQQTLNDTPVEWHDDLSKLPAAPLFLIANEFFDALGVRQFRRDENGWREHQVGVRGNALELGVSEVMRVAVLEDRLKDTKPGDIVETCAPAQAIVGQIAAIIASYGGAAVIIDYGDWQSLGDTLQALKLHKSDDILAHPGQADLTAHVDFKALAAAAKTVSVSDMIPQGVLLERLGITPRAQSLAKNLAGEALDSHIAAHRRLTHPEEMGTLFKAIALYPVDHPAPPGFAS